MLLDIVSAYSSRTVRDLSSTPILNRQNYVVLYLAITESHGNIECYGHSVASLF